MCDPFGGIGTTAIQGASRGCRVVCCELEPKFVDLARRNFDLHRRTWEACGDPLPVMVQGDSRHLRRVLSEANVIVSSPPYAESCTDGQRDNRAANLEAAGIDSKAWLGQRRCTQGRSDGYGQSPGQLGAMPSGDVDAVISSPPYAESVIGASDYIERMERLCAEPFESLAPRWRREVTKYKRVKQATSHCHLTDQGYGSTSGQLGALPSGDVAAVVSSPPFMEAQTGGGIAAAMRGEDYGLTTSKPGTNCGYQNQGDTTGNLSSLETETFWTAAARK